MFYDFLPIASKITAVMSRRPSRSTAKKLSKVSNSIDTINHDHGRKYIDYEASYKAYSGEYPCLEPKIDKGNPRGDTAIFQLICCCCGQTVGPAITRDNWRGVVSAWLENNGLIN